MHNPKRGHVSQCLQDLGEQAPNFVFCQTSCDGFSQRLLLSAKSYRLLTYLFHKLHLDIQYPLNHGVIRRSTRE
jgi:hypothetical protein